MNTRTRYCSWAPGADPVPPGVLNIAVEHVDDDRGRKRIHHRQFRFRKDVDDNDITASYTTVW